MKKLCVLFLLYLFTACNNADDNTGSSGTGDSVGLTNPSVIDTLKHPSGVDNSSVISTDTAAMNTQNALRKKDSAAQQQ